MQRDYLNFKGKYIYFRNPLTRKLTRMPDDENSPEFAVVYDQLFREVVEASPTLKPKSKPAPRPATCGPGSIGWVIERYLDSDKFAKLSDKTRENYRIALDQMRDLVGTAMLHDLTPQGVDHYSAKIAKTHSVTAADVHTTLLSNLWEFAKRFEEFKRGDRLCPTIGRTRHYEHDGEGHLAWPDEVIDKFDGWADWSLRRVRMGLHYTGQRGVDVVKMLWSDYDGECINVVQQKTGERVWIYCPEQLRKMLDGMERVSTHIFTNQWKRPYTNAGSLSCLITKHMKKIGFPGYSMHGLRKNAGMELAMAGCTVPEIMSVLGHRSPKMAMFYVQQADKKRLSKMASQRWNAYEAEKAKAREEKHAAQVEERRANIKAI